MDRSDVTLDRMRSFVRVAERGSLSAVAREFEVGQSTVTRHLRELEEAVGVALLSRTTRRLALTEEGRRYYEDCLRILALVDRAGAEARGRRLAPAGTVRLSCTAAFGVLHLSGIVFAFQDRHPGIAVDLSLTDERVDLVRDGLDLAIRLAPLADSSLKLRPLGRSTRILVASPDYLAAHGRPEHPREIAAHEGIRMANVAGSDAITVRGVDGLRHTVPFGGRLRVDHGLAVRQALLAGRGIGASHRWLVDDCLADGRLEAVLPGYGLSPVPLNLLIVPERAGIARVRLLADFLVEWIRRIPGIAPGDEGG